MRMGFGHSGRLISLVGTPQRLSVLSEMFKWRLVTRVLGLPLKGCIVRLGESAAKGVSCSVRANTIHLLSSMPIE
jgi:hypothetical protein